MSDVGAPRSVRLRCIVRQDWITGVAQETKNRYVVSCATVLPRHWRFHVDTLLVIGRVLFALLFLGSAMGHLTKTEAMTQYAQYRKLPAAKANVLISGVVLVLGALSVVFGIFGDLGALALIAFLVVAAFVFHAFWKESDPQAAATEQAQFMKNIALVGAAIVLFALFAGDAAGPALTDGAFDLS
jgi:putative oxidoreductase